MKKIKITHLTSAHPRYDTRIFIKECCSLAKIDAYSVSLIVADALGNEEKNGVSIYDVGKLKGRFNRMFKTTKKVYEKAITLDSDIYHFHDPELIPIALKLKKLGKKVIFDIHEDVAKQIKAKTYLNSLVRQVFSFLYGVYEMKSCQSFDYLLTATPMIKRNFEKKHSNVETILNYPIIEELSNTTVWETRKNRICHIGSLAEARGVVQLVESLAYAKVPLDLCGDFRPKTLENELRLLSGWAYVDFHGFISRDEVKKILSEVKIGLVTLHPTQSYLEAIPVKMFEYMAAGIPVIASDFEIYHELLKGYDCALFVDPLNPEAIADAITYLLFNDAIASKMGEVGRVAVVEKFNWYIQEKKLLSLYKELLR